MNLKSINKIFFLIVLIFLSSCKSLDMLSKESDVNFKYIEEKELLSSIKLNNTILDDQFSINQFEKLKILKWSFNENNENLIKLKKFNLFNKDIDLTYSLVCFLINDELVIFDYNSALSFYNLTNFNHLKTINLDLDIDTKNIYPTSITKFKSNLFSTYSNGVVINFDLKGKIIWKKKFKNIIKSPIKIYKDNIIILLDNKIISIDPFSGLINWEYLLESSNPSQYLGGDIVDINNYLFFVLPNNRFGVIDTIFNEKNDFPFSKLDYSDTIRSSNNNLHSYNNILAYFDQKKYLSTIDIIDSKLLNDQKIIFNVNSFKFYKNSLITFNIDGLLRAYNIFNNKVFWDIDISNYITQKDSIIEISNFNNSLIIFFKSGKIININAFDGSIISIKNIKLKNIIQINSIGKYLFVDQKNGNKTIFLQ